MEEGAFNTTFMSGPEYTKWVETARTRTRRDEGSRLPGNALMWVRRRAQIVRRRCNGRAAAPSCSYSSAGCS